MGWVSIKSKQRRFATTTSLARLMRLLSAAQAGTGPGPHTSWADRASGPTSFIHRSRRRLNRRSGRLSEPTRAKPARGSGSWSTSRAWIRRGSIVITRSLLPHWPGSPRRPTGVQVQSSPPSSPSTSGTTPPLTRGARHTPLPVPEPDDLAPGHRHGRVGRLVASSSEWTGPDRAGPRCDRLSRPVTFTSQSPASRRSARSQRSSLGCCLVSRSRRVVDWTRPGAE